MKPVWEDFKSDLKKYPLAVIMFLLFAILIATLFIDYSKKVITCHNAVNECNQKKIVSQCKNVKSQLEISNILTTCK